MFGAILGDMIGSPYEFDMGNKRKENAENEKISLFVARGIDVRNAVYGLRKIRYGERRHFRIRRSLRYFRHSV